MNEVINYCKFDNGGVTYLPSRPTLIIIRLVKINFVNIFAILVERLKVRWKTLRDGFVRHLKKKKTMEMYTAAAAMRPYKLEKQIAFLLPHVSFRDEDDNGGSNDDEDTSSLLMATDIKTNECESSTYDQQAVAEMLYEQSNIDKACSEHEALDRSIHFLCDQRYKQAAATNYKWVTREEGG